MYFPIEQQFVSFLLSGPFSLSKIIEDPKKPWSVGYIYQYLPFYELKWRKISNVHLLINNEQQ